MEPKISTSLRSWVASWLSHLDQKRLAQTCQRWRVAVDSPMARETLDLRPYDTMDHKEVPSWCAALLRIPDSQVQRSWRRIHLPEASYRTFVVTKQARAAYAVLVKLMRHAEYVYGVWCTVDFASLLADDAAHQPQPHKVRVLTANFLYYMDDEDWSFGEQKAATITSLSRWRGDCPQLTRIELEYGAPHAFLSSFLPDCFQVSVSVMLRDGSWMQQDRDLTPAEIDNWKTIQGGRADTHVNVKASKACCVVM